MVALISAGCSNAPAVLPQAGDDHGGNGEVATHVPTA